jgi:succinate dehydrogenase / fumarate reductase cytochrome b subunit
MIDNRPVYLNLIKIRLPVAGMVSLAHRGTGILLFLALPFAVYLLDLSLESQQAFETVQQILRQPILIVVQFLLLWSLAHHFFAGIRFLLIDAEIGVDKSPARTGAWLVFLAGAMTSFVVVLGIAL